MRIKAKKILKVRGFKLAGLACGIKSKINTKDLGIIFATDPKTQIAGVFTTNKVVAAPVLLCRKHLKSGCGTGRIIVVNSGNANAATGKQGAIDCLNTARRAASYFGVALNTVFVCSTGKIGAPLPVKKILAGIERAKNEIAEKNVYDFSSAIMTTDAHPKRASTQFILGGKKITITAIAKGAGMIEPNMATMLCYVLTDLKMSSGVLQRLLKECVDDTLNSLTVDGDMSTNDTVLLMASGAAENADVKSGSRDYKIVRDKLTTLLEEIATQIALDGEGATKCLHIRVTGARSGQDARLAAKAIGNSQLVKCAMFGTDPNWGRIIAAVGYSGALVKEALATVKLGPVVVFSKGRPLVKNEKRASVYLKENTLVDVVVDLGLGKHSGRALASDLTYKYVSINADYRT